MIAPPTECGHPDPDPHFPTIDGTEHVLCGACCEARGCPENGLAVKLGARVRTDATALRRIAQARILGSHDTDRPAQQTAAHAIRFALPALHHLHATLDPDSAAAELLGGVIRDLQKAITP